MLYALLDSFLLAPFTWLPWPLASFFLGIFLLVCYAIFLGEITSGLLYVLNSKYYTDLQKKMIEAHNKSVSALHAGNKEAYLAINRDANEHFGKFFFSQAGLSISSLWPVPFALQWLELRFHGIEFIPTPFENIHIGYVFVYGIAYIIFRIAFSKVKFRLPFFRYVHAKRQEAKDACGQLKSLFARNPAASVGVQQPKVESEK